MPDPQAEMRAFIENGLGIKLTPAECMGWGRDGELIAAVAFHNYYPKDGSIELSAYSTSRDWLSREKVREIFAYPFDQLGVRICIARIDEHNARARRIWRAFGAKEYVIHDLRADGVAECVYVLHRDQWAGGKFMRDSHG